MSLVNWHVDVEWWDLIWSIMWGIRLRRNAWLFDHKCVHLSDILDKAMGIIGEIMKIKNAERSKFKLGSTVQKK